MSDSKLNEFDAAKQITATLLDVDKDKRVQVLRWAAESAGVTEASPMLAPRQSPAGGEPNAAPGVPPLGSAAPDIKTFVNEKKPKNDVQFATVVAYYYRFQVLPGARKETIHSQDLQDAARMAGRSRFKKPAVPLANASTLGYLDRAGGGQFSINAVGENLVAMALPGSGSEGPSPMDKRKKAGVKKKPRARKAAKSVE
jgi:hypothetical protein